MPFYKRQATSPHLVPLPAFAGLCWVLDLLWVSWIRPHRCYQHLPGFWGNSSESFYASVCSLGILAFMLGVAVQQVMGLWDAWDFLGKRCNPADQPISEQLNLLQGTWQLAIHVWYSCIPSIPSISNIFNAVAPVKPPHCVSILDKYWKSYLIRLGFQVENGPGCDNPKICKP